MSNEEKYLPKSASSYSLSKTDHRPKQKTKTKIGFVGFSETGLETARAFLADQAIEVSIFYKIGEEEYVKEYQTHSPNVRFQVFDENNYYDDFNRLDFLIVDTSIPRTCKAFNGVKKTKIINDIEYFAMLVNRIKEDKDKGIFNNSRHNYLAEVKIIGVAGSNGKTTVCKYIEELLINTYVTDLQKASKSIVVAGSNDEPIFKKLHKDLKYIILHLDANQLRYINSLKIDIGTIVSVSDNIPAQFSTEEEYYAALHKVYKFADILVCNKFDPKTYPPQKYRYKANRFPAPYEKGIEKVIYSYGKFVNNEFSIEKFNNQEQSKIPPSHWYDPETKSINIPYANPQTDANDTGIDVMKVEKLNLPDIYGDHNYLNFLAAFVICRLINKSILYNKDQNGLNPTDKTLLIYAKKLKNPKDNFELVHLSSSNKVRFINDNSSRNTEAVKQAIKAIPYDAKASRKVWLLIGGDAKGQDFSVLQSTLAYRNDVKVICYGKDAQALKKCRDLTELTQDEELDSTAKLNREKELIEVFPDLEGSANQLPDLINKYIAPNLKDNDIVLFSPGCSYEDQFASLEQRSQAFSKAAKSYYHPSKLQNASEVFSNGVMNTLSKTAKPLNYGETTAEISLVDKYFLALVLIIFGIGYTMVVSATEYDRLPNSIYYLPLLASSVTFLATLWLPLELIRKYLFIIIIVLVIAILSVTIFGDKVKGAARWINLGVIKIQPAEFIKPICGIYLAHFLTKTIERGETTLLFFVTLAVFAFALATQPDFGTSLMLFVISLVVILFTIKLNNWDIKFLLGILFIGLGAFVCLYFTTHIGKRLDNWRYPFADVNGNTAQIANSFMAIYRGGYFGQGVGNSVFKSGFLPEHHTDFILAVFVEEHGYLGLILLLSLFLLLVIRMFKISFDCRKNKRIFEAILVFTFTLMITYQVIYSTAMQLTLFPIDGATFPLLSYGGSSYAVTFFMLAVVFKIDYENRLLSFGLVKDIPRTKGLMDYISSLFKPQRRS